jgi:hypothetical protein
MSKESRRAEKANKEIDARDAFVAELTELTKKHGIKIWGCGCCGSPGLLPLDKKEANGSYSYDSQLSWSR